ncbi:hypothetical protein ElyMa_005081700 [Elysia marginata]|uniref:WSC domain-containing protein n=1 Tax=Elysia marginata TaxID=1093978 RepID=A0AAV4JF51_9GAST|nr:hypothetical protein ElyMa_005081700 [Elysia marginata]
MAALPQTGIAVQVERSTYIGCLEFNVTSHYDLWEPPPVFLETSTSERDNRKECQEFCRGHGLPFVARQGSNCTCMSSMSTAKTVPDYLCTDLCADSVSHCGNQSFSLYSVYTSVEECVSVSEPLNFTETSMFTQETCQEFCRGQDSTLAFWRGGLKQCDCLSKIPDLTEVGKGDCRAAELEEEPQPTSTGRIFVIESLDPVTATSCLDLFNQGIFVHGDYYLSNGSKIFCNFYGRLSAFCLKNYLATDPNESDVAMETFHTLHLPDTRICMKLSQVMKRY